MYYRLLQTEIDATTQTSRSVMSWFHTTMKAPNPPKKQRQCKKLRYKLYNWISITPLLCTVYIVCSSYSSTYSDSCQTNTWVSKTVIFKKYVLPISYFNYWNKQEMERKSVIVNTIFVPWKSCQQWHCHSSKQTYSKLNYVQHLGKDHQRG